MAQTATKSAAKKPTKKCASASAHRAAQNKYVKKNPAAQAARVKKSEQKHKGKVKERKKRQGKPSKGGPKGRPRSC